MSNVAAMTSEKAYEAPEEKKPSRARVLKIHPEQIIPAKITRTFPPAKLLSLLHAVEKNMKVTSRTPAVLFMSPHKDAGADVIAFETAYAGALSGKRVLYVGTSGSTSEVIRHIRGKVSAPLNTPQKSNDDIPPFVNVQGTSLFFATLNEYEEHHTLFPDSNTHQNTIDELREIFDLIIICSESGLSNPLTTILSGLADASIIVAEEGRTRIPAIRDLRRLIDMHGGHVAGIVLNKCRFYIPRFIYQAFFGI
jgi:protein-tyrosine kinase